MARVVISAQAPSAFSAGSDGALVRGDADPVPSVSASQYTTDRTAFETALATLVADGATPTQAHVTAVNNAYTTLKADLNAGGTPAVQDLVVSVDLSKFATISKIQIAFNQILVAMAGAGVPK